MTVPMIPFNRPYVTGAESDLMADAVRRGHLSGDGYYSKRASRLLEEITGAERALLTTSCTHALEMSAMLLDVGPGDEIIMPSFTFVSCANAFAVRGALPVFVDIRSDTYNIDESLLEAAITPQTRAILVVHYAGVACDMDKIATIAERHGVPIIEDAAHALGASFNGRPLGAIGQIGTLSFHETKNIHSGEGGAILLSDESFIDRAEIIREKGTNRSRFFRGQVDKYTWVDLGSSYLPSDLLAAFLTAQLENFDDIQRQRLNVWNSYLDELRTWANAEGFTLPTVPDGAEHPAHLFALLAPTMHVRQAFIEHMASKGVRSVFHYVPLHSSPMGRRYAPQLSLPVTDSVSDRLVRLPLFAGLERSELDRVQSAVVSFRCQ